MALTSPLNSRNVYTVAGNITQIILESAERHSNLLQSISELDHIPQAKEQQGNHLAGLRDRLKQAEKDLEKRVGETRKERKEHEAMRDSVGKKLLFSMAGKKDKFQARALKEEQEYVDALETEMAARGKKATLEELISEATTVLESLQLKHDGYLAYKSALNRLYSSIFDGPTPDFPQDDLLENNLTIARATVKTIKSQLAADNKATKLLTKAKAPLDLVRKNLAKVLRECEGTFKDREETNKKQRKCLNRAEDNVRSAKALLQRARAASPHVGEITMPAFDRISYGDLMFRWGNVVSKRDLRPWIQKAEDAQKQLTNELSFACNRVQSLTSDLTEANEVMDCSRLELETYRRTMMLRVVMENPRPECERPDHGPPPPDHEAGGDTSTSEGIENNEEGEELPRYSVAVHVPVPVR